MVASVARPPQELKGFARVELEPGATAVATVELDLRAFSYWSSADAGWLCEPGAFEIRVGASSRDIRGTATVTRR